MTKTIDIDDELTLLFKKEETLAFFDICQEIPGLPAFSGLCKISRPRGGTSTLNYLGLLFVFDIANPETRKQISKAVEKYEGPALKHCLKALDYAVSAPVLNPGPDVYIKQIDLVFRGDFVASREFVQDELFPALCAVGGLPQAELNWWQENSVSAVPPGAAQSAEPASFFKKLKNIITSS
jgi:hypothetical protein